MTFVIMFSGAAGSRTRVQTRRPYAFYMLSSDLIFVHGPDQSHLPTPYLLYLVCSRSHNKPVLKFLRLRFGKPQNSGHRETSCSSS